jgi:hypothetical protein
LVAASVSAVAVRVVTFVNYALRMLDSFYEISVVFFTVHYNDMLPSRKRLSLN